MTSHAPHRRRSTRRWLEAVTWALGVVMGLMLVVTSATAFAASPKGHACCCDSASKKDEKRDASSKTRCQHQVAKAGKSAHASNPCAMGAPSKNCQCHLDSDDNAPAGEPLALSASTFSFAPALAATLHPQLDIPLARAPSAMASEWLHGRSPPEHLYLLHQTFLN